MKSFQRHVEDFVCTNCGFEAVGDGYTNHCPKCLWSKHVDVMPGDRSNPCQGMMEPVEIEYRGGKTNIVTRCVKCGHIHRNRKSDQDSSDAMIAVARLRALRLSRGN